MKLKLDMSLKDLAFSFGVSLSTVSRVFSSWMIALDVRLSPLVSWPDREDLWRTMPQCFQDSFGKKVTVIIDCFEVLLIARQVFMPGHRHSPPIRTTIQSGRGFTIQESLMFHQAQLAIPAFTS